MEIRYIDQDFLAGIPTEINLGGRYAFVMNAPNPFTLEVGIGGQYNAKWILATVGDAVKCEPGEPSFNSLRITAAGNDHLRIVITDGQVFRSGQNTDVSDRAGRLLGIFFGNLGQVAQTLLEGVNALWVACKGSLGTLAQIAMGGINTLRVSNSGIAYGSNFVTTGPLAALGTIQVFSAASNVNGAHIWLASNYTASAAAQSTALIARTVVPAAVTDGDTILGGAFSAGVAEASCGELPEPVYIAPGKGCWFFSTALETLSFKRVLYTLY